MHVAAVQQVRGRVARAASRLRGAFDGLVAGIPRVNNQCVGACVWDVNVRDLNVTVCLV